MHESSPLAIVSQLPNRNATKLPSYWIIALTVWIGPRFAVGVYASQFVEPVS